jgi:nitroreductase
MHFEDLIRQRYSARAFQDRAVPEPTLRAILTLAQHTPSWCNTQPWEPVVTVTPAATDRFRAALWAHVQAGRPPRPDHPFPVRYEEPHATRRKRCGGALYTALGIARENKRGAFEQTLKNFRLFEAPHVLLMFCHESLGFYGGVDCGLYLQSFLLAAQAHGVQTCAQAALATYPDFTRTYFDVPADRKLLFGCSFGYADPDGPANNFRTERESIETQVRWIDQ